MNQRTERRRKNRRVSQALFYDFPHDRRRREYERRGRTPERLAEVTQGERRRFEESGTE